jgi:hypothetical protein
MACSSADVDGGQKPRNSGGVKNLGAELAVASEPQSSVELFAAKVPAAGRCQGRSRRRRWPKASLYNGMAQENTPRPEFGGGAMSGPAASMPWRRWSSNSPGSRGFTPPSTADALAVLSGSTAKGGEGQHDSRGAHGGSRAWPFPMRPCCFCTNRLTAASARVWPLESRFCSGWKVRARVPSAGCLR